MFFSRNKKNERLQNSIIHCIYMYVEKFWKIFFLIDTDIDNIDKETSMNWLVCDGK